MQYWSFKQVAEQLGITYQAIYKDKEKLIDKGYVEQVDGVNMLNIQGYNYLVERRKNIKVEQGTNEQLQNNFNKEYLEMLKERVKQLENELQENKRTYQDALNQERERTQYFKSLFEQKDKQINLYLLPGSTEKNNKSFFSKLFNK